MHPGPHSARSGSYSSRITGHKSKTIDSSASELHALLSAHKSKLLNWKGRLEFEDTKCSRVGARTSSGASRHLSLANTKDAGAVAAAAERRAAANKGSAPRVDGAESIDRKSGAAEVPSPMAQLVHKLEEAMQEGIMDGSMDFPGVLPGEGAEDGKERDLAMVEAELEKCCREAQLLADAVKEHAPVMPDVFVQDLEELMRQNAVLQDAQHSMMLENARLMDNIKDLRAVGQELREAYRELERRYRVKCSEFNDLDQSIRQGVAHREKVEYAKEIASLVRQAREKDATVATLTEEKSTLMRDSQRKLSVAQDVIVDLTGEIRLLKGCPEPADAGGPMELPIATPQAEAKNEAPKAVPAREEEEEEFDLVVSPLSNDARQNLPKPTERPDTYDSPVPPPSAPASATEASESASRAES